MSNFDYVQYFNAGQNYKNFYQWKYTSKYKLFCNFFLFCGKVSEHEKLN